MDLMLQESERVADFQDQIATLQDSVDPSG